MAVGIPAVHPPQALAGAVHAHLDDGREAVQVEGLSVEAAHIVGLARFIRKSGIYHLDLPQAVEGFLQIFNGMAHWWAQLAYQSRKMV
ncbi:hypothetical protein [Kitasatospora sp. KL5]|uniref:hypothetical protein n=1 Tax=Kitasatospora sp. KL5 TaxID=3425125 RepID=UPI003D6FF11C